MSRPRLTQAQRWLLGGIGAVALLALVLIVAVPALDDGDDAATTTTSTSTTTTSTTTSTTTTTVFVPEVDPFEVAFPSPFASQRFDEPAAAARAYAIDVLGFSSVSLGAFDEYTDGWGEVVATTRPTETDPPPPDDGDGAGQAGAPVETRIEVRREADDSWYVLGSETDDISVTTPTAGASLATPFETTGRALAFEGTVDVLVRAQEGLSQRGAGFVTGSGTPPAGPFRGRIFFSPPSRPEAGILVFRTLSAADGSVERATSFPVRLTSNASEKPAEECGDTGDDPGSDETDVRVVKVFFHCGLEDYGDLVPLRRTVPADDPAVLRRTMEALVAGPTETERSAGFTSPFPVAGGAVDRVVIDGGVATVDLDPAFSSLANSSHNILTFRSEVFRTATQFSSVAAVEVLFGGSCQDFAEWSQSDSCLITQML